MSLCFTDRWVWDFWFAQVGEATHIFYLQAPRSIGDPEERHWHATIGHAVSQDMVHWEPLPDALMPAPAPAFDDLATWTGSVIQHNGLWYMFYTGLSQAENGRIQRIGLATSADLFEWQRHPSNPVIHLDTRWYEQLNTVIWPSEGWRDPHILLDPHSGLFHAFITARIKTGNSLTRGTIAHAVSDDLLNWQVQPPLMIPRQFEHLEVPQIIADGDKYYLLFSWANFRRDDLRLASGIHYMVADDILGPYEEAQVLLGSEHYLYYSGKLIQMKNGQWTLMAALFYQDDGQYIGEITDPIPVTIAQGNITLAN